MHPSQRKMKAAFLDTLPSVTRPVVAKQLRKTKAHSLTGKGSTADNAQEAQLGTPILQRSLKPLGRRITKDNTALQDKEVRTVANEQEAVRIHCGRSLSCHSRSRVNTFDQSHASVRKQSKHTARNDDLQKDSDNFDLPSEQALVTPDPGLLNNKGNRDSSVPASFWHRQARILRGVEEFHYAEKKAHTESSLPPLDYAEKKAHTESSLPPLGTSAEQQHHQQATIPASRSKTGSVVSNSKMAFCQQTSSSYSFTPRFDNSAHAPIYQGVVQPFGRCAARAAAADMKLCDVLPSCSGSATVTAASFTDVDFDDMDVMSSSRSSSYRSCCVSPHGQEGSSQEDKQDGESLCQNLRSRCGDCGSMLAHVADVERCSSCGWKQVDSIYMFASSSCVKDFVPNVPRQTVSLVLEDVDHKH